MPPVPVDPIAASDPPKPIPDRVAIFLCEGGCARRFTLEAHGVPVGATTPLTLAMYGHLIPEPQGCIMPLGEHWMMFWLGMPPPPAVGSGGALAIREQITGPYVICRECIRAGSYQILRPMLTAIIGGKSSFGPQTLMAILKLITAGAQKKNAQLARGGAR